MSGNYLRVAVIPWGDPKNWKYVNYCFEDVCKKGFSTLSLLTSSPSLKPDLTIIYVLDTLYDDVREGDYESLTSRVRDLIKNYLCVDEEPNIVIEVIPGIMKKRIGEIEILFNASPSDTKLMLLYRTYVKILDKTATTEAKDNSLEILIDTTHGLNYFTILTREAVFEASSMLAAHGNRVKVKVFNSDPLDTKDLPGRSQPNPCAPKEDREVPKTRYNLLYEVEVRPWDLTKYLRYSSGGSSSKLLTDVRDCNINQEHLNELIKFSRRVTASYRVGALVELLTFVKEKPEATQEILEIIDKAVKCWRMKAKVERLDEKTCETTFTKLQEGFRLLLHAHAVVSGTKKLVKQQLPAALSEVKEARKKLLEGSEITSALVDSEIGLIEKLRKENKIPRDWTTYAEIMEEKEEVRTEVRDIKSDLGRTKRNFIAHAGLLKDFIEIKKEERVELRIKEECRELINEILDEIFRELT